MSEVASLGGFGRQYQVNVDPNRLRNYGLSIQRVVEAVRGGNVESAGRLSSSAAPQYMVRGRGYAKSVADFESIVVSASETGTPIRIRDIGRRDGSAPTCGGAWRISTAPAKWCRASS